MKTLKIFSFMLMAVFIFISFACNIKKEKENRTSSFDMDWHFIEGNPANAESPAFDDSGWRLIDLPHDWSIEDLPDQGDSIIGPFTKASEWKMRKGYTVGGTAWYRKTFTIDKASEGKVAYLNFDGIYEFGCVGKWKACWQPSLRLYLFLL